VGGIKKEEFTISLKKPLLSFVSFLQGKGKDGSGPKSKWLGTNEPRKGLLFGVN
jgi:hypothetical protein